jgi:hypothetical protein
MRNRVNHTARPRKGHPYAFKDYDDDCIIHQSIVGFLESLWKVSGKERLVIAASFSRPRTPMARNGESMSSTATTSRSA